MFFWKMIIKKEVLFNKALMNNKFISSSKSRLIVPKTDSIATAYGFIHQKDFFEFMYKKNTDIKSVIKENSLKGG